MSNAQLNRVVEQHTKGGRTDWLGVAATMGSGSSEMWRSRYRRLVGTTKKPWDEQRLLKRLIPNEPVLLTALEREGLSSNALFPMVAELERQGYLFRYRNDETDGWEIMRTTSLRDLFQDSPTTEMHNERQYTVGIISDTHIGSAMTDWDGLANFYDICEERGIKEIYHVGDLTDGFYMSRGIDQEEQSEIGFHAQWSKVVKDYPRRLGVTTYFITGNHDASHMRNGGASIGHAVAAARDDMVYLGHNQAKVWLSEHTSMLMVHPSDGVSQQISLKLQKIIENRAKAGQHADIFVVGHYHKSCWIPNYYGVAGLLVPSFQNQTGFMMTNGLVSEVGGILLHVREDIEGHLLALTPEYIYVTEEKSKWLKQKKKS